MHTCGQAKCEYCRDLFHIISLILKMVVIWFVLTRSAAQKGRRIYILQILDSGASKIVYRSNFGSSNLAFSIMSGSEKPYD